MNALDGTQRDLVVDNLDLVRIAVNAVLARSHRHASPDEYDDWCQEAARALVLCALRYPDYCAEHSYEATTEWFRIFATRRMKGAVLDLWRSQSPLTRRDVDYSTYALKHGEQATVERFGITLHRVREAVAHRNATLGQDEIPESEMAANPSTLWDVLSTEVDSMPPICRAWITLVYVHHVPPMQARDLLGFKNRHIPPALALIGYVQFRLVSAVLDQQAA